MKNVVDQLVRAGGWGWVDVFFRLSFSVFASNWWFFLKISDVVEGRGKNREGNEAENLRLLGWVFLD